jgi:hypothetical protein
MTVVGRPVEKLFLVVTSIKIGLPVLCKGLIIGAHAYLVLVMSTMVTQVVTPLW